jgi:hypothetical protein
VGSLYIETDPQAWYRPEDSPWRHLEELEEPWSIPMNMGTRFVIALWRGLIAEWERQQEGAMEEPAEEVANGPSMPPWEEIQNIGYDRELVKLLWDRLTSDEIGHRLGKAAHTIDNRLSQLRKRYGKDVVPLRKRGRDKLG